MSHQVRLLAAYDPWNEPQSMLIQNSWTSRTMEIITVVLSTCLMHDKKYFGNLVQYSEQVLSTIVQQVYRVDIYIYIQHYTTILYPIFS